MNPEVKLNKERHQMNITSQTMFDILVKPVIEEQANDLRLFSTIRGDGELSGDMFCYKHAHELPECFDFVEVLEPRKDDECCVCKEAK